VNSVILHETMGAIAIREENGSITALDWCPKEDRPEEDREDGDSSSHSLLDKATGQLDEYFHGKRQTFDLPLEPRGTEFQKSVWRAIAQIPYGETRSYGSLARELGTSPRPVGTAAGKNPLPIFIPCHRVVEKQGALGGYSGGDGVPTKRHLLRLEGHSAF
jgi:methylated-DNA-[protein]-cysteine S-methyltransferase